jgi:hypothetical protein
MTAGTTPYRSGLRDGHDGFTQLLRAEWTKFRTVRGWMAGTWVAALVLALLGLVNASATHSVCAAPPGQVCGTGVLLGPDGEAVTDRLYFAHQPLDGDGSITARQRHRVPAALVRMAPAAPAHNPDQPLRTASRPRPMTPRRGLCMTLPGVVHAVGLASAASQSRSMP